MVDNNLKIRDQEQNIINEERKINDDYMHLFETYRRGK